MILTTEETELIKRLRAEASEVKDCATKYCFQALALSTVALGAILPLLDKFPLAGFAAVPLVIFLLATIHISFHKFETANRLYGYELHVCRRARLENSPNGWNSRMRRIGWEEAFYAWRVVQPFIYRDIYQENSWYQTVTMRGRYLKKTGPLWFRPTMRPTKGKSSQNTNPETGNTNSLPAYSAGNYLFILHYLLFAFALCATLILPFMCLHLWVHTPTFAPWWGGSLKFLFLIVGVLVTVVTIVNVVIRARRMHVRRQILQDELLSINSCAIVWLAVVVAHHRALEAIDAEAPDYRLARYQGYTPKLAEQAEQLCGNLEEIYTWVHEGP